MTIKGWVRVALFSLAAACGSVTGSSDAGPEPSDASGTVDAPGSTVDASAPDAAWPDAAPPDAAPLTSCVPGSNHVCLTAMPDPMTVFDTANQTYFYANNLTTPIWHGPSNTIIGGSFSSGGYFQFTAESCPFSASPDQNTAEGTYGAMVQLPALDLVIHTDGFNPSTASEIQVATINVNGTMGAFSTADFGGNPPTTCTLISSSWDELLCLDSPNVYHYRGTAGSNVMTLTTTITLSQAPNDVCGEACWGGTFAFDGAYYYFAFDGNVDDTGMNYATYEVYDTDGTYVGLYESTDAAATGRVNGLYFDWSVGRYTVRDGYAIYRGGTLHVPDCSDPPASTYNDTQIYSAVSTNHQ